MLVTAINKKETMSLEKCKGDKSEDLEGGKWGDSKIIISTLILIYLKNNL